MLRVYCTRGPTDASSGRWVRGWLVVDVRLGLRERGAGLLASEPESVHELDELVLAMLLENFCDVVVIRRHVTELIPCPVAEVGPRFC